MRARKGLARRGQRASCIRCKRFCVRLRSWKLKQHSSSAPRRRAVRPCGSYSACCLAAAQTGRTPDAHRPTLHRTTGVVRDSRTCRLRVQRAKEKASLALLHTARPLRLQKIYLLWGSPEVRQRGGAEVPFSRPETPGWAQARPGTWPRRWPIYAPLRRTMRFCPCGI